MSKKANPVVQEYGEQLIKLIEAGEKAQTALKNIKNRLDLPQVQGVQLMKKLNTELVVQAGLRTVYLTLKEPADRETLVTACPLYSEVIDNAKEHMEKVRAEHERYLEGVRKRFECEPLY